jgi:Acetyltransferase (GNAT) family.
VREIKRLEEEVKPHEAEIELQPVFGRVDYFIVGDDGKIKGFALIGLYPNAFSRHDIFIGEFYIIPECRRHGYGTIAVKELVKLYPDYDISMFVLKKNFGAKLFWNRILSSLDYVERTSIGSIKAKTKNCEWFYWSEA